MYVHIYITGLCSTMVLCAQHSNIQMVQVASTGSNPRDVNMQFSKLVM